MSYLDGITFGYDQISSGPDIPLMFTATSMHGKDMLMAKDEWVTPRPQKYEKYPPITEKPLQKIAKDPSVEKETFTSSKPSAQEKFTGLSDDQFNMVLIVIVVFLIAMQIKMHISITIMKERFGILLGALRQP